MTRSIRTNLRLKLLHVFIDNGSKTLNSDVSVLMLESQVLEADNSLAHGWRNLLAFNKFKESFYAKICFVISFACLSFSIPSIPSISPSILFLRSTLSCKMPCFVAFEAFHFCFIKTNRLRTTRLNCKQRRGIAIFCKLDVMQLEPFTFIFKDSLVCCTSIKLRLSIPVWLLNDKETCNQAEVDKMGKTQMQVSLRDNPALDTPIEYLRAPSKQIPSLGRLGSNFNKLSERAKIPCARLPKPKPSNSLSSRRNDEKPPLKMLTKKEKFYEIFKDMSFEISFMDALTLMPKFASTLKALIGNKEKLSEMARTPLNEHCSAVILNKLPEKLGDPGRFLIPCKFPGMDECLALADLGKLRQFNFRPIGIAKDVNVELVVFPVSSRLPCRALIDVYEGELTLRVGNEAITYNLDQTLRYSVNYNDMTANRIDVVELACEEYSQEVLGFSDVIASGNPTPYYDLIVSNSSPTLTPFGDRREHSYFEALLSSDPLPPLNQGNYLPEIKKELKICEAKTDKSSIDELSEVELKDLLPHLELYIFGRQPTSCQSIIAKDLCVSLMKRPLS
ncbi:hypothetical protein Tco_0967369 [Tanacetum coccineum]